MNKSKVYFLIFYREWMARFDEINVYNQAGSMHCMMHIDLYYRLREPVLYPNVLNVLYVFILRVGGILLSKL